MCRQLGERVGALDVAHSQGDRDLLAADGDPWRAEFLELTEVKGKSVLLGREKTPQEEKRD